MVVPYLVMQPKKRSSTNFFAEDLPTNAVSDLDVLLESLRVFESHNIIANGLVPATF